MVQVGDQPLKILSRAQTPWPLLPFASQSAPPMGAMTLIVKPSLGFRVLENSGGDSAAPWITRLLRPSFNFTVSSENWTNKLAIGSHQPTTTAQLAPTVGPFTFHQE